jgi:hypothetical protein
MALFEALEARGVKRLKEVGHVLGHLVVGLKGLGPARPAGLLSGASHREQALVVFDRERGFDDRVPEGFGLLLEDVESLDDLGAVLKSEGSPRTDAFSSKLGAGDRGNVLFDRVKIADGGSDFLRWGGDPDVVFDSGHSGRRRANCRGTPLRFLSWGQL